MDFLRNLPTQQPQQLTQLIQIQPGRVVSMAMSRQEHCQMTLLAFGDGENDLTMLRHAGIGVAMGSASDFVKSQADYTTGTVDEDGVIAALRHFELL